MKIVLIGPPGTGKTTEIINIATERLKLGPQIAILAFTKRAAHEVQVKLKFRLTYNRTIHSLCFMQLGLLKSQVFDIDGFATFANLHCTKKKYDPDENEFYKGATEDDLIIFDIGLMKAKGVSRESYKWKCDKKRADYVWNMMDLYKKNTGNLYDFDDMLVQFTQRGEFPKLHTIILDEAQDLTFRQRQAFNALCAHNPNALIVEALDPDQAIFSWAGSEVNMDEICKGADVRILGESHRVPGRIHDYAMKVIRKGVNWAPAKHEGAIKHLTHITEIDKSLQKNILILARNRCYVIPYMRLFHELGIQYGAIGSDASVRIGTIHESKGAEADNVLLDLNMTKKTWDQAWTDDERKVWYTGITRAKKNLYIMQPHARCNALNLLA